MRLPLLLLPVVLVAVLLTLALTSRRREHPTAPDVETSPEAYARARRHAAVVAALSWGALVVVGAVATAVLPVGPDQGIALACVPAAAGVAALLVAAIGERTWPRPTTPVRRASLVRRSALDVGPRGLGRLVVGWSAALLATLLATGLSADADGRGVTVWHSASSVSGAGPYPGAPYGVPIATATVVLLAATLLTLHLVAARPAVAQVSTTDDARLRTSAAGRVLAGVQLVVGCTLAGVLLVTGTSLRNASTSWSGAGEVATTVPLPHTLGVTCLVAAPLVLVTACVVTGVALVRASRATSPAPTSVAA